MTERQIKELKALPEDELREQLNQIQSADDWDDISRCISLPENIIRKFERRVNWLFISIHQKISEKFIREFADKVEWYSISKHQKLSEKFIKEFSDRVDWYWISSYQNLSEKFIKEFANRVNWHLISIYQKLSENFIREFSDRVNWKYISVYQKLSEDFIREFADKADWSYISKHQVITPEFAKEFNIEINNNSQRTADEWKALVQNTNLYKCHEDYFIAYKGIRSDRYSKFNFQYQYLAGETYKCFSDYSSNENSFGLSAWTKKMAAKYCDELVVMVKIYYSDVTAVVHDGGKIRCKRLTVLD